MGAVARPSVRRAWWRLHYGGPPWAPWIRPEFARRIALADRQRATEPVPEPGMLDGARREHWRQLTAGRLAAVLETLAASAGSAGVEVRDPFLDRRLMEFCFALPAEQKIRGGQTRIVARHGLHAVLPPEIRDRRGKAPIALMLGTALATYGTARLGRLMAEAPAVLGPYVVPEAIRSAHRRYLARGRPADAADVWRLAVLTLWLRRVTV